jgi:hypothetical protein
MVSRAADLVFRNELQLSAVLQEDVAASLVGVDADSSRSRDATGCRVLSKLGNHNYLPSQRRIGALQ